MRAKHSFEVLVGGSCQIGLAGQPHIIYHNVDDVVLANSVGSMDLGEGSRGLTLL